MIFTSDRKWWEAKYKPTEQTESVTLPLFFLTRLAATKEKTNERSNCASACILKLGIRLGTKLSLKNIKLKL